MYSKLFYKCLVHFRPKKIFHWKKKCQQFTTVQATLFSYYKTEATNRRLTSKCTEQFWLLVVSATMHSRLVTTSNKR